MERPTSLMKLCCKPSSHDSKHAAITPFFARRPGFAGQVTRMDLSPYLADVATRLATEEGMSDRVMFRVGDTQRLDFPDAAFDAVVAHTLRIMRQMPRVLRTAGLALIAAFPYVLADIGTADDWLASVESYRRVLPQGGTMTVAEADAWADALRQDSEAGVFFGAYNFYSYVAKQL